MKNETNEMFELQHHNSSKKTIQDVIKTRKFLIPTCSFCNKQMNLKFVEGATIYGDKWYHADCWQSMKKGECKQ